MSKTMIFYYTTGQQLQVLLRAGVIPTTAIAKEKPCVFFSSNQEWEPSANLLVSDGRGNSVKSTKAVTYEIGGGLARIGVDQTIAPYDWKQYVKLSEAEPKTVAALRSMAYEIAARPSEWFFSFERVPKSKWLCVQTFDWNSSTWFDHPT
jgi:hypothetical protein